MNAKFLQIHFLTSYPASLLNRDDAGFAKRIPFGGASRLRISSQCLKRHWRKFDGESALQDIVLPEGGVSMSVRSRQSFEEHVFKPLLQSCPDVAIAEAVTEELIVLVLGESAKAKKEKTETKAKKSAKKGKEEEAMIPEHEAIATSQVTVLGRAELEFLVNEGRAIAAQCKAAADAKEAVKKHFTKEKLANLKALKRGAGLDSALFGRMVTSDILARCDAAIHVAHAFSTHEEAAESDYFSAIDDIEQERGELGSGHINTTELTSGLFYGYVVVDVPLLVSNLEGCPRKEWEKADRALASEVIRRLAHLVATVSPGAKLGSTAPYAYAHLVLAESGNAQPRTLANAFLRAVSARPDLVAGSYHALADHLRDLDSMYGRSGGRRLAALGPADALKDCVDESGSLAELALWAAARVRGG